jgi:hypothetical protein
MHARINDTGITGDCYAIKARFRDMGGARVH